MTLNGVIAGGTTLPKTYPLMAHRQCRGRSYICFDSCPIQHFDQRPGSEDPEGMLTK